MKKRREKTRSAGRKEPKVIKHANRRPDGSIASYSWRVIWYDEAGVRQRKNFTDEGKAAELVAAEEKKRIEREHGLATQVTSLTKAQLQAAELAFAALKAAGYYDDSEPESAMNLTNAVEWYLENPALYSTEVPSIAWAAGEYLRVLRKRNRAPKSIRSVRGHLREFVRHIGPEKVSTITSARIEAYLDTIKGTVARSHRCETLHALFSYLCGKFRAKGACIGLNPVKQVTRPEIEPGPIHVYTFAECKTLIQESINQGYAVNAVLRLFSMIREEETAKMVRNQKSIWRYIDLDAKKKFIRLTKAEVKTKADKLAGGRAVAVLPVLESWLREFQRRGWDLMESRSVYENVRRKVNSQKMGRTSGYHNLIRHTSISYRLRVETSVFTVAQQAGTSESIIRSRYLTLNDDGKAKQFFSLTPDKFNWPAAQPRPRQSNVAIAKLRNANAASNLLSSSLQQVSPDAGQIRTVG